MFVFMFPGQSSADEEMVARAMDRDATAQAVADAARPVLGAAQASRYLNGGRVPLETNHDVQVSTFLTTQMHLAALQAAGLDASLSLGLSLGEYSHLVHIGALAFEDALALVDVRGRLYDESPHGLMVTVLGVTEEDITRVVEAAQPHGQLVISNYNTPTQHVVSGHASAVAWATTRLEEEHGAQTVLIEPRVPMHSPLMEDVASRFRPYLERARWQDASRPYWPNVRGEALASARPDDFVDCLTTHVSSPVRWRRSIEHIAAAHPDATFVEVGPGEVLHNMLGRRWLPVRRARTDGPDSWWSGGQHEPSRITHA